MSDEPISNLDAALDRLLGVLTLIPDLPGLIDGLRGYEDLLALVPVDAVGAIDAVSVAAVWGGLADIAGEVLALKETSNGSA